jgi:hypothetical protein
VLTLRLSLELWKYFCFSSLLAPTRRQILFRPPPSLLRFQYASHDSVCDELVSSNSVAFLCLICAQRPCHANQLSGRKRVLSFSRLTRNRSCRNETARCCKRAGGKYISYSRKHRALFQYTTRWITPPATQLHAVIISCRSPGAKVSNNLR